MEKLEIVRTCKACGVDNPNHSVQCQSCASNFAESGDCEEKMAYYERWVCPDCGAMNERENEECAGCFSPIPS